MKKITVVLADVMTLCFASAAVACPLVCAHTAEQSAINFAENPPDGELFPFTSNNPIDEPFPCKIMDINKVDA